MPSSSPPSSSEARCYRIFCIDQYTTRLPRPHSLKGKISADFAISADYRSFMKGVQNWHKETTNTVFVKKIRLWHCNPPVHPCPLYRFLSCGLPTNGRILELTFQRAKNDAISARFGHVSTHRFQQKLWLLEGFAWPFKRISRPLGALPSPQQYDVEVRVTPFLEEKKHDLLFTTCPNKSLDIL